jgi:tRNA(Ile)-lysidine synthase TilS/MesJ
MLPILLTRRIRRIKPLLNYSKSHVVTSCQYLGIFRKKIMQKEVTNKEREIRRQEKGAMITQ